MAWDSSVTAQMTGMYQGMAMNQMAYSNQIGQQGPMYGSTSGITGDRMMGGAMNAAASFGGPMASAASSLAPMAMMGMGMGGMAATGVGIPLAAGLAAGQHVGSQMYTGAQQQQSLNQTLRGSFSFQNSYGGTGFTRSDMSQIGNQVRGMSEQFGPGGEIASFKELSSLAGKMGQMGFAQGVRDVQEFGKRFKEMTTALKTMARDLGTTLEGAMEFAASAKGSGIFGTGKVTAFTGMARATAVSGGLAMSEVTGAASIGSQIARSIGGLGSQGANAGMRTIGQIGTAQQMGVLSEEDIYNVTGQTGAEGRQSYAASSLQRTGKFLQSGRGRRVLASLAEKNGTLNEENVEQLLNGGMSIGETMRLDKQQLGKVGRANFIRNEGRLRGAAMERLGGFLPALQLQEWAQSKGVDINNMDDRSMLFAQRQLGMGRDEVDQAIKMANNMPQIIERQRRDKSDDQYMQKLTQARKGQGIQGIEQRLEQAREIVNGKMQKAGQEFFNQGSEQIDEFFNKLSGQYVETYSKDIDSAARSMGQGGAIGKAAGSRVFGIGGSGMSKYVSATPGALSSASGGLKGGLIEGSDKSLEENLHAGSLSGIARNILGGRTDRGRISEAGFATEGFTDKELQDRMGDVANTQLAAATGFNPEQIATGKKNEAWVRDAYSMGKVSGEGDLRMQSFGDVLKEKSPELSADWDRMSQAERAQMMNNMERGAGINEKEQLANHYGAPEGLLSGLGKGGFKSVGKENEAFADAVGYGDRRGGGEKSAAGLGKGLLVGAGNLLGGAVGSSIAGMLGGQVDEFVSRQTGSHADKQAVGSFLKGEQGRDFLSGILSDDNESAANTRRQVEDEIGRRGDKDPVTGTLRDMLSTRDYLDAKKNGNGTISPEAAKELEKRTGKSVAELEKKSNQFGDVLVGDQARDRAEGARRWTERGKSDLKSLASVGVFDAATGNLASSRMKDIEKLGPGASQYAATALQFTKEQAGGQFNSYLADTMAHEREGMSAKDKMALGGILGGGTEQGATLMRTGALQGRLEKAGKKGGRGSFYSQALGAGLSKEEVGKLDFGSEQSASVSAGILARGAGLAGDSPLIKQIQEAGLAGRQGKSGKAAELLDSITHSEEFQKAKKKQQEGKDEAENPLQAAIKKNGEVANDLLKKIAIHSGAMAAELAKTNADTEGPKTT